MHKDKLSNKKEKTVKPIDSGEETPYHTTKDKKKETIHN